MRREESVIPGKMQVLKDGQSAEKGRMVFAGASGGPAGDFRL